MNLFVPSSVAWAAKGAVLHQTTTFPDEPATRLRWTLDRPVAATLKLRHPRWSRSATILVNGQVQARSSVPGRYLEVARTWHSGDTVELRLAMEPAAEVTPAAPDIVAFTYGPLVLAAALGRAGLAPGADIVVSERKYGEYNAAPVPVPVLAGEPAALARAIRATGKPLEFTLPAADGRPVRLIPYHRVAHERYATYWKIAPA